MRTYVQRSYSGTAWAEKVAKWPNNRVIAVYYSLINRQAKKKAEKKAESESPYKQLSLFDMYDL